MQLRLGVSTLVELLRLRASEEPDFRAYTFLVDGELEEVHVTYGELDRRARAIAARLQEMGAAGERALLLYAPGLEYVTALFGCFYAGVVAVPIYPPRRNKATPRLQSIIVDCDPSLVLTTPDLVAEAEKLAELMPELAPMRWLATEEVPDAEAERWTDSGLVWDDVAFLQYTSGSTGNPKGVMVSHGNLIHNFHVIETLTGFTPEERSVIWLPPYHDMGLIGGILQPMYTRYWAALMAPVAFVQRPARWLEAITRYRATTSGGPNFAYELCVHAISPEDRAKLDLSSWTLAFNGAEPVRAETLDAFTKTFGPLGFRRETFYPCYGLAEGTLMATGSVRPEQPRVLPVDAEALQRHLVAAPEGAESARRLVGSGQCAPDQEIRIVEPESMRECAGDGVGEVWVRGPSVTLGYWGREEETANTFGAYVAGSGDGPFMRTGDLGFLAPDGELYITGRVKDLIIIRGRNHYPHDIEQTTARAHRALRPGGTAAFSVDRGGEERLVVVQEVGRQCTGPDLEEIAGAIRAAVAREHELQVYAVALVKPGVVPKTSSGKIQRLGCRADFLRQRLPVLGVSVLDEGPVATDASAGPVISRDLLEAADPATRPGMVTEFLHAQAARVLGVAAERIDPAQPLVTLGIDSLMAAELKTTIETSLGVPVALPRLLDEVGIDALAAELLEEMRLPAPGEAASERTAKLMFVARPDVLPLSFAQERLWFLDVLQPGSAAYNIPVALRISGSLDVAALERALGEIVRRHETLRTVFASVEGKPAQVVLPAIPWALRTDDVSTLPEEEHEAAARRLAEEEAAAPFDLAAGPLVRARLVRLGEADHLLVVTMHHIVSDGWSTGVLVRELGALYPAFRDGSGSPLAPLPMQYADWAIRQRERLRSETVEEQLGYWRERLRGMTPLPLPTDHPRPPTQSFRGATHRFEVPAEVMEGVRALARAEGATTFMALLAGLDLLLSRYAGERDVAVGTTVSNRDRAEVLGLIGLFVNTLVLRTDVAPEAGFRELLGRVRSTALEAFARQDVPFERLVEEVQPERDLSRNPLFQVIIAPQNTALEPVELSGTTLTPAPLDGGTSILDLTLFTWERSGGALAAALEYATDLFEADTIERMAAHWVELLRSVAADPDRPAAEVPFLRPAERAQVMEVWNDTARDYPERCLHELFAEQAARTPDAVALRFQGRSVTYAELDRRANRLAHHLRALGVGPERRVGLRMERTPELVVAMLATLKAGGAYIPLDTAFPPERVEYMLDDAGAALVVTQAHLADRLPAEIPRVLVDEEAEAVAARPDTAPESGAKPGNLAYVLYTSGSTGRPKGVQIEHRSASHVVHFIREMIRDEDRAVVLGSTSINFDVSIAEIFGTLCWGGTLVLVENVLELPRVADEGIRTVAAVPSAVAELLRAGGIPASVRAFDLGGEPVPASLASDLHSLPHVERVLNLYGPTEDTTYSTWSEIAPGETRVRIGRPVANSRVYVLDPAGNPAPVGVEGEVFLAGAGVSRGYHNRPDLTAEKYLPDPFSEIPGARLYRTGDRGRWLASGELDYLGRIDQQVKVRGFRIEPGEIESVLRAHSSVEEAVVLARQTGGETRLVAYLLPADEGHRPAAAELRESLREHLPDYMVPSAFVVMDAFPRTPSGKTDRRALPEPVVDALEQREGYAAPRTPTEEVIAAVWAEVLGLERVGIHDDFFDLGGHSLLGAQLVARVRDALGADLPIRALFDASTVASLAERVDEALRAASGVERPRLAPVERDAVARLPLSFAQERLWFLDRLRPGSSAYNMPAALRFAGPLEVDALRRALDEIVRRHEALRSRFLSER
ncbi:MAG: amino acid adenylation domain-containing protein, partial [Gemmatimonadetes bacterium]|nr:amino acid adenylation domain-containing protein [Gemmatimonadota bacterium]